MVTPVHYSITPAGVTGQPLLTMARSPLTGRVVLRAEAMQGGRAVALQMRDVQVDKTGDDPRASVRVTRPSQLAKDGTTPGQPVAQENQPGSSHPTPD